VVEALVAGLFGLLIGSFLNVCIYRMPRDLSVVHPRSFCPNCEKTIPWYDNIPLLTWVLLAGRCRYCNAAIPWRYPAVELLTGLLFFVGVLTLGLTGVAFRFCLFAAIQVALIFTDLEERILPDEFTLGGTVAGLILAWFVPMPISLFGLFLPTDMDLRLVSVIEAASGGLLLAGVLWSIGAMYHRIRGREGLGFGDVKMVACIGAFLGLGPALLTVVLGSVLGSVCGLAYIWLTRKDAARYELPFGSFLGIAALLIALRAGPLESWFGPLQ
jgi:leader peptidase (prepilin peptidase) / N-methyltransferase